MLAVHIPQTVILVVQAAVEALKAAVVLEAQELLGKVLLVVAVKTLVAQFSPQVVEVAHLLLVLMALLEALQVLAVLELHHPYQVHR